MVVASCATNWTRSPFDGGGDRLVSQAGPEIWQIVAADAPLRLPPRYRLDKWMRMKLPDDLRSAVRIPLLLFFVLCSSGPPSNPTSTEKQEAASSQGQIRITNTLGSNLMYQPHTDYPKEARKARIHGVVKLDIVISKTGEVAAIHIVSGHPALIPAALLAVQDCRYAPTYLNRKPVESKTQVDVPFTLNE